MINFRRLGGNWRRGTAGGIAVGFAVALPVVVSLAGLAIDYAIMSKKRGSLQQAADAAALAGAREIPLALTDEKQIEHAVTSFAVYQLTKESATTREELSAINIKLDVTVAKDRSAVTVGLTEEWTPFFAHFIAAGVTPVSVSATARFLGQSNICLLGLEQRAKAIYLDQEARLSANNCAVFSNSLDQGGIEIKSGVELSAQKICSAGGAKSETSARIKPAIVTDCPAVADPLAGRQPPRFSSCDHNNMSIDGGARTISPGVYCGGLKIDGKANVTFSPGVYVIYNGNLEVTGDSTASGDGVGFFIAGEDAKEILFKKDSHIAFSAPRDGAMAGLLIFEDRDLPKRLKHVISSSDAKTLIGTIYLPVGELLVDAQEAVAGESAYTAIVAQAVELKLGPHLILNADYGSTDVPVPTGITGSSQVVLSD